MKPRPVDDRARVADFIVRISDVYPDGRSILIVDYIRRARYRDTFETEKLMQPGEVYNVCSGTGLRVREIAERVLNRAGVSAEIASDTSLLRPIDVPILIGDSAKLRTATGWEPTRSIDDIIDDLIHAATP